MLLWEIQPYNIKGSKIVAYILVDLIPDLIVNQFDNTRNAAGLAYPINKHDEVSLYCRCRIIMKPFDTQVTKNHVLTSLHWAIILIFNLILSSLDLN